MQDELIAWAEDCVVRGPVELPAGRMSDAVNATEFLRVAPARVQALDDGRVLELAELEVERRDLHLVLARGREGDPARRLRTVRDPVVMRIGPFTVRGNLHRAPNAAPLAALQTWARFIPVTEATFSVGVDAQEQADVLLVNRERIGRTDLLDTMPAD